MKKTTFLAVNILVFALVLSACGVEGASKNETTKDGEDTVLQYSFPEGSVSYVELAYDLGYLGELTLEKVGTTGNGPDQIQLAATNEIDYAYAFNGAVIKAIAEGVDLKAVVGGYGTDEQTTGSLYVLEDSGIKSGKDLIGKKIGVNVLGAHAEFVIVQYLRNEGLTEEEIKKVQLVVIPSTSAEQTLRSKQVDAVRLSELTKEKALETGGIFELTNDLALIGKPFTAGSYSFTKKYIEENPTTVKTFVEGVAKAVEWTKENPREVVVERLENIIKKRNPNESLGNLKYWKSSGLPHVGASMTDEEWQLWIDFLVDDGQIEPLTTEDVYTNEFNPYVNK